MAIDNETLEAAMAAVESDEYLGFCLECGEEHQGVEPDAHDYQCMACGKFAVAGAEHIVLMS